METGFSYDQLERKIAALEQEIAGLKGRLQPKASSLSTGLAGCGQHAITFEDIFDIAEIQRIQDAFAKATGIASIITRPDGTPITQPSNFCRLCRDIIRQTGTGLKNCLQSDALLGRYHPEGPIVMPCQSGGLWDGGASISIGDRHIANWLIGQIRNEELDEEAMIAYARVIGADEGEFRAALAEVTYMSREQFEAVARFLFLVANLLSKSAFQLVEQRLTLERLSEEEAKRDKLEKQLHHAQKLEAIGRLAGGVAHDFNNILSVINGYSELILLNMEAGHPLREKLEIIHGAGQKASRLTQQLVAFSRKQIISPRQLHLGRELQEISKMFDRLLGEDITVTIQHDAGLWPVKMDQSQLEQILVNLAVNARDAMPDGGQLLFEAANAVLDDSHATGRYEVVPGDYVKLAVSDTGSGMTLDTQERIFEPFFTTKAPHKGTGLGLATVYGIVKQNNGYITVASEEGCGSVFTLYLPRCRAESAVALVSHPGEGGATLPGGTETILLVEDEETVRALCITILSQLGYTVLAASHGKEALALATRHEGVIGLLLTDVVMPEMSGPELADGLRQIMPRLQVVYMSGYTENAIVHRGILAKNIHFLQKPITPNALAAVVRTALDEPAAGATPPVTA